MCILLENILFWLKTVRRTLFSTSAIDVKTIAVGGQVEWNSEYGKDNWGLMAEEHSVEVGG